MFAGNSGKGQFTLAYGMTVPLGSQSTVYRFKDWHLCAHENLRVTQLFTLDNNWVGWFLGMALASEEARLITVKEILPFTNKQLNDDCEFEKFLLGVGGRYLAILFSGNYSRVYPDPSGSLSVFFDKNRRCLGSTPELLTGNQNMESSWAKRWGEARRTSGTWYPGGLCPDLSLKVLYPNHFLCLDEWNMKRYWPGLSSFGSRSNFGVQDEIEQIARIIVNHITALAKAGLRCGIGLTAGQDSRSILAAAKNADVDLDLYIDYQEDKHDYYDLFIATILADICNNKLRVNPISHNNDVMLTGFGGEVGRAFYWSNGKNLTGKLDYKRLLSALQYRSYDDELDKSVSDWLDELKSYPSDVVLDLLYIEHRLGTCMGPVMYSYDNQAVSSLYPYNSTSIYRTMMSLPKKYRMKKTLGKDVTAFLVPEFTYIPYNDIRFRGQEKYQRMIWYNWHEICNPNFRIADEVYRSFVFGDKSFVENLASDARSIIKGALKYPARIGRGIERRMRRQN